MVATSPDRRVRRTRAALMDALLELMSEKGYEAVTVADLIDRADVGRSTFYSHYAGKEDLLDDGLARLRSLIDTSAADGSSAGVLRFSLPFLRHIQEHRRLARAMLGRSGSTHLLASIESMLADMVRAELSDPVAGERIPPEALVHFVVGAYTGLLRWWLDSSSPVTPEELHRIAHALVTPAIRASSRMARISASATTARGAG